MTPLTPLRLHGDDVLARRTAAGDPAAFAVLVARHQTRIECYCRSILRHDEDARDAAQNAMTKAFVALRDGRGGEVHARSWLYRIAHNEAISLLRRRRAETQLPETLRDDAHGPLETTELRQDVAALLADVRELPNRARHALLLREVAGLDHATVGRVLGITPGAARQAVHEARTSLRGRRVRARRLVAVPLAGPVSTWLTGLTSAGVSGERSAALTTKVAAAVAVVATGAGPVAVEHARQRPAPATSSVRHSARSTAPRPRQLPRRTTTMTATAKATPFRPSATRVVAAVVRAPARARTPTARTPEAGGTSGVAARSRGEDDALTAARPADRHDTDGRGGDAKRDPRTTDGVASDPRAVEADAEPEFAVAPRRAERPRDVGAGEAAAPTGTASPADTEPAAPDGTTSTSPRPAPEDRPPASVDEPVG